jgi:hypothetical protein
MIGTRFYGRMGNVLFQAAHTIALALKHNQEFSFPNKTDNPHWNPLYLQHLVNPNWVQGKEDVLINENGMQYQPVEWKDEWKDKQVVLNGYWQSEKYFKDYRQEILYLFDYPYELKEVCSIHARFGDYFLVKGKHIIIDEPYLTSAMNLVTEKTGISKFKVFSDDLKLFKEKFGHLYDFAYSNNSNEVQDLVEISCCHSNINSSSTFSWWGSWLNRNPEKIIITQAKWFQDGWMGMNTSDVIPETWIKL